MHYLYFFAKYTKWIGVISLIFTFFSDSYIFKMLCSFGLLVFVEMAMEYPVYKCSKFQKKGIKKLKNKYTEMPSVDNYKCEVDYILPFKGVWSIINGCYTEEYSHSWGIPTQRYAYDFIVLDENAKSHNRKYNKCENYYCYEKDILAPADGVVVEIVNNAKDSVIFILGQFYSRAKHIAGNHIVIKHTENEYTTMAHLQKDSILVNVGDEVKRGQTIAKCGNTGNSTEPHLHFQLQSGQSFYDSAGLPIQFSNIKLTQVMNYEKFDPRPHMAKEQVSNGYVTRGFNVENQN